MTVKAIKIGIDFKNVRISSGWIEANVHPLFLLPCRGTKTWKPWSLIIQTLVLGATLDGIASPDS
jgi:hypothetical protein